MSGAQTTWVIHPYPTDQLEVCCKSLGRPAPGFSTYRPNVTAAEIEATLPVPTPPSRHPPLPGEMRQMVNEARDIVRRERDALPPTAIGVRRQPG
jgi:hypothetical protein